jgi:hypothetical protein
VLADRLLEPAADRHRSGLRSGALGRRLGGGAWDAELLSLSEAEASAEVSEEPPRLLLIATQTPTRQQLRDEVFERSGVRPMVDVHSPVLQSRTHFVTTDIDRETQQARCRLQAILQAARSEGVIAEGHVGDPIDPIAGVEDELRRHTADEVILTTHDDAKASWVESALLERLPAELHKPVIHIVVDEELRTASADAATARSGLATRPSPGDRVS